MDYKSNIDSKINSTQFKGLMAIVVMLGHICFFMNNIYFIIGGGIAVGVFFYYSAYGSQYSYYRNENYFNGFFRKKFINIFLPFMIANTLYFLSLNIMGLTKTENWFIDLPLAILGINLSNSVLWYVWHLVGFLIIFYFLKKYIKYRYQNITLVILYLSYMLIGVVLDIPVYWYTATSCLLIGYYFGDPNNKKILSAKTQKIIHFIVLTLWIFIIIIGELFLFKDIQLVNIKSTHYEVAMHLLIIPLFLLSMRFLLKNISFNSKVLTFLGSISYEIYLYHMFVFLWVKNYMANINIYLQMAITIGITLLLSYLIHAIYKKLIQLISNKKKIAMEKK